MEQDPDSGLFLPVEYLRLRDLGRELGTGVYVTWDDVKNEAFDPANVPGMLRGLPADQVLSVLGTLSFHLSNRRPTTVAQRIVSEGALAYALCRTKDAERISQALRRQDRSARKRDVFVFPEQLLMAVTLTLLYAEGEPQTVWDGAMIGDLLLASTSLISLEDEALAERPNFGVAIALRKIGAFSTEQARYLIPRYYDLIVRRMQPAGHPHVVEAFERAFSETTGLRLREYLAFAILYCAPFSQPPPGQDILPPGYPQDTARFEELIHDERVLENARSAFVTLRNEIVERLGQLKPGTLMNYMPIRQRPLIRVESGALLPLSMQFLLDKISTGVYWTLFDEYLARGRLNDFTNTIGEVFEDYILDLFDAVYDRFPASGNVDRFLETDIRPVEGAADVPRRRADCLILEGDNLIVMEISTASLKVATMDDADTVAFREEVRERLRHEFTQVFDTIEGLRLGKLEVDGIDRKKSSPRVSHRGLIDRTYAVARS